MALRGRTSGCAVLLVLVLVQQCAGRETLKEASVHKTDDTVGDDDPPEYSKVNITTSYNTSATFDPKAMEQLYYVTNFFMHAIQPDNLYPEGFLQVKDGELHSADLTTEWSTLVRHYAGIVSVAAVGLVFLVFMPFVGLIFCCCRCAGCCGARNQTLEKRRDPCKRITLGIMLAIIATIILFGVVCAFVTNEYMEDGSQTLPSKLTTAVSDTNHYFANTKMEIRHLLINHFKELQLKLEDTLKSGGKEISEGFQALCNVADIDNLLVMVNEFSNIEEDLKDIQNISASLQNNAVSLSNDLNDVQNNLTEALTKCSGVLECKTLLEDEISHLNTSTGDFNKVLGRYFPKLPNITENLDDVKNIAALKQSIDEGKLALDNISSSVNETIQAYLPTIVNTLQSAGDAIEAAANQFTDVMNNVSTVVNSQSELLVSDLDQYIKEYGIYRYYLDISTSSVMLLILLCITLGLFYGFCGKRPDYGDDCCSKATGARFLMLGVYVMFIFSTVFMIITLAHFLLGITIEKVFCQSVRNPENSQLLTLLDQMTPLDSVYKVNISFGDVLSSCHMNNSIYQVLQIHNIVNISEVLDYTQKFNIEERIKELEYSIDWKQNVTLLDDETKQRLLSIGNSSLNNLTDFTSVLNNSVVDVDLNDLASRLDEVARNANINNSIETTLIKQANQLRILQGTVDSMTLKVEDLKRLTDTLEVRLKFNRSSLAEAVNETVMDVIQTQQSIQSNGSLLMKEVTNKFATRIVNYVNDFLNQTVNTTMEDVGRCGPISQVINGTLVATCDDILNPFNGFWASIGWCLVLFIPAIILSVKLATLYRKSDPYHTPLPDSEYLYDAYADRDNIPLANGPDKKNHHRRYNETYDNSSGYLGDYSAHLGRGDRDRRDRAGSGHRPDDARYTDMAPKHWDYSNGALPRYHSPPLSTEYERPPPYYYPGPGDSSRR